MNTVKLILIFAVIIVFIALMMMKKIPTILALPIMGVAVAFIAACGSDPMLGLFDWKTMVEGKEVTQAGIFNFVIVDGVKMLAGSIVTVIFASSFSRMLMKQGIIETIIKKAAEFAGDRPVMIAIVFYFLTSIIFMAIGGLGGVILVGSIVLPIMMSAGIKPLHASVIFLFAVNSGGIMNPMNYSAYLPLLAPSFNNSTALAQEALVTMCWPIYLVALLLPLAYVFYALRGQKTRKAWATMQDFGTSSATPQVHTLAMFAPIIPVIIVIGSTLMKKAVPTEIAIVVGMLFVLFTTKCTNRVQLSAQSFLDGTKDVAGVILLMIGLGILIKGFQFPAVQIIMSPAIKTAVSYLQNPATYVIGFTLASALALYRGPLNTFGIGGALPALFGAAGFSPLAIVWALRATGNMQGFGDPTNSHNIWIADFTKVDVNDILKHVLIFGFVIALLILTYAVAIANITLTL